MGAVLLTCVYALSRVSWMRRLVYRIGTLPSARGIAQRNEITIVRIIRTAGEARPKCCLVAPADHPKYGREGMSECMEKRTATNEPGTRSERSSGWLLHLQPGAMGFLTAAVIGVLGACGTEAPPGVLPTGAAGTTGTSVLPTGPVGSTAGTSSSVRPTGTLPTGTAGTGALPAGTAGTGASVTPTKPGGDVTQPVAGAMPCDVTKVVAAKCQNCHGATPIGGAPMPLMTQADF